MRSFEEWKLERTRAFDALAFDISRFAQSERGPALEFPLEEGGLAFSLDGFSRDAPAQCVSPAEWVSGFLSNLPVIEFPRQQTLGFDASKVRFSANEEEHFRVLLWLREVREKVVRKGLVRTSSQQKRIAYLSAKFHFGKQTVPTTEVFHLEYEFAPADAPQFEDSGDGDDVRVAPVPYVKLQPRYARDPDASWIEDPTDATGLNFVLGPASATFSSRERFLLPLNLLMIKFVGAVVDASDHLLVKMISPPSSGNKREKKRLARTIKLEEDKGDDEAGEESDVSTVGDSMALLDIKK